MTVAVRVPAGALPARAAVGQLARIEGARLVRHPIVLAGALLSVAFAVVFARASDIGGDYFVLVGPAALPLAIATLIAANSAALRSDRSDTGELYGSLASPAHVRTIAHLLAVGWAAGACFLLVAVGFVAYRGWQGLQVAPNGRTAVPSAFELAQGPFAVATLGVLGVLLARWVPYLPIATVAGVGVLVAEVPFAMWNLQDGYVWFAPVVNPARTGFDSSWPCASDQHWPCPLERFATEDVGWHLLYLAGVAGAGAALALLRDERRPRYLLAAVAGIGLAAVAGLLQIP